jgi:hypothetical protein
MDLFYFVCVLDYGDWIKCVMLSYMFNYTF